MSKGASKHSDISDKELVDMVLQQTGKNTAFFLILTPILAYAIPPLGKIGTVIGWIQIAISGIDFVQTVFSFLGSFYFPRQRKHKIALIVATSISIIVDLIVIIVVYAAITDTTTLNIISKALELI